MFGPTAFLQQSNKGVLGIFYIIIYIDFIVMHMYSDIMKLLFINCLKFVIYIFEPTCAHAQWALMHHFLYVTGPKRLEKNSYLKKYYSQESDISQYNNKFNQIGKRQCQTVARGLTSTSSCIFNFLQIKWTYEYDGLLISFDGTEAAV